MEQLQPQFLASMLELKQLTHVMSGLGAEVNQMNKSILESMDSARISEAKRHKREDFRNRHKEHDKQAKRIRAQQIQKEGCELHIWGWGVLTTVLEYWSNAALWLAYQTVNKYLACVFTSTEYVSKSFTSTPHLTLTVIFFEITTFS